MTTQVSTIRNSKIAMLALMLVCIPASSLVAVTEIYLRAEATTITMPDGRVIGMWGFAQDSAFGAHDGLVTVPGPCLAIDPEETHLVIHLENNLPEPVSIIIPGQIAAVAPVSFVDDQGRQRIKSFTHETPSDNAAPVSYEWTDLRPGTFLYQSGSHPAVQVQMGLYGCLTKNFAEGAVKQAYEGTQYDRESVLVFSEIDPALHDAVVADDFGPGKSMTSTMDYVPKYFLINGQAFTTAQAPIPVGHVNERILLRLVNAGIQSHVPVLHNLRASEIAEDGFSFTYAADRYAIDLPPAKTRDVLIVPAAAGTYPMYDRALRLTNNAALGGGMMARLEIAEEPAPQAALLAVETKRSAPTVTKKPDPETKTAAPKAGRTAVASTTGPSADFDANGTVDAKDVFIFVRYWRAKDLAIEDNLADLNGDGRLDDEDVILMRNAFRPGLEEKQPVRKAAASQARAR